MIKKSIQIALAALLVFMVAAPVIVGVYDAVRSKQQTGAEGSIKIQSNRTELGYSAFYGSAIYGDGGSLSSNSEFNPEGLQRSRGSLSGAFQLRSSTSGDKGLQSFVKHDTSNDSEGYLVKDSLSVSGWYSGDSAIVDSFSSGDASLIYRFEDGSIVDFGNPYILDWTDIPIPDDYVDVMMSTDASASSVFAPEKAYANPISWLGGKLKYLAIKSGYWKSLNSMIYSLGITICMSSGMSYTASTQAMNKIAVELPAISRVITSETAVFTTEDTAMLVSNSIARVASRKVAAKDFPAALNTEIAANITAVETTGMLAGGASGNFINSLYQLAATGGVPASILFSDFGLYVGSWLGGNFEDYFPDTAGVTDGVVQQINIGGQVLGDLPKISFADELSGYATNYWRSTCTLGDYALWTTNTYNDTMPVMANVDFAIIDGKLTCVTGQTNSVSALFKYDKIRISNIKLNSDKVFEYLQQNGAIFRYSDNPQFVKDINLYIYNESGRTDYKLFDGATRTWNTDILVNVTGTASDMQLVGSDAEFDTDGNLINPGNINVSDVTAPGYVQPGTFQEALDQMHATVTDNIPAKPDSPAFGNNGTIEDWINQNKPQPPAPSEDSSQDDFKIEDLEKVFPFSIPWDLYYLLAIFTADPVAPNFNWQFDFAMAGKHNFAVDLAPFDSVAQVCRACETVLFCIGLALVTRNLIRG